ncbi:ankyrin repeat domain-containing protein [Bacteroidota bacterium]
MIKNRMNLFWLIMLMSLSCNLFGQDIFVSIKNDDLETVKNLIKKDKNILEKKDKNLMTPLAFASYYGKTKIVNCLIEEGANVKYQRGENGETSLHFASYFDYIEIARMLVDHGIDINAGGSFTAIIAAIDTGSKRIAEYLISQGASVPVSSSILHDAASHGMESVADLMVKKGVDLFSLNDNGGSLVHSASKGGLSKLVKLLISKGVRLNIRDRYGLTPLHIAASGGHSDVVKQLIIGGADVEIRTNTGLTPYQLALRNEHLKTAQLLKDTGADTTIINFMDISKYNYFGMDKPGLYRTLFAPGILSTSGLEHGTPSFSPDGNEVYWNIHDKVPYTYYMKRENGRWTFPELAPIFNKYHACQPKFSWDGKRIYFNSDMSIDPDKIKDSDIYYIERNTNGWSEPINPGVNVNSEKDEKYASVSADGTLYFMIDYDLYRSEYKNKKYQPREKLEYGISTEYMEMQPTISKDQSYLIFPSARPGGKNRINVYISFHNKDGSWSTPKSMGEVGDGIFTGLSPDEKYLFFCGGDISWVNSEVVDKIKEIKYPDINKAIIETFKNKGVNEGIALYKELKNTYYFYYDFNESLLNNIGYRFLGEKQFDLAIEIFKLNVWAYPEYSNAYDSLGEAYMKSGEKELSIKNYQKSLELNPANENAKEMLLRLRN